MSIGKGMGFIVLHGDHTNDFIAAKQRRVQGRHGRLIVRSADADGAALRLQIRAHGLQVYRAGFARANRVAGRTCAQAIGRELGRIGFLPVDHRIPAPDDLSRLVVQRDHEVGRPQQVMHDVVIQHTIDGGHVQRGGQCPAHSIDTQRFLVIAFQLSIGGLLFFDQGARPRLAGLQRGFGPLAVGNVEEDAQRTDQNIVGIAMRRARDQDAAPIAIGPLDFDFVCTGLAAQPAQCLALDRTQMIGIDKFGQCPADQLTRCDAEDLLGGRVGKRETLV